MHLIIAFIVCIAGILISSYIFIQKSRHQKLACPRDNPCDLVLHSRFGKTLGVPNELLGILYFGSTTFLLYGYVTLPVLYVSAILYILFFTLSIGGLFSIYLVSLQAFVIKRWCAWCLGVAAANFVLIASVWSLPFSTIAPLLASQKVWWVIIHNLGFILGLGSATLTDVFFFRFLKDNTISQDEKEIMDTFSSVIWVGLAILIVSGIALYVPEQERLLASSKFLLKLVVVSVVIFNGVLLNMLVAPHMRRLSFEGTVPARRFRRLAFALGGISIVSWYSAFLLGSLRKIDLIFSHAVIGYGILIVCVVIGSQMMERIVMKKRGSMVVPQQNLES
jgi:uncharacterized membrane protein